MNKLSFRMLAVAIGMLMLFTACSQTSTPAKTEAPKTETTTEATTEAVTAAEAAPEYNEITLYYGTSQNTEHVSYKGVAEFGRLLEEKSGGKLKLHIYHSGELSTSVDELVQMVQMGTLDATTSRPANLASAGVKSLSILSLPFMFRNVDHAYAVLDSNVGVMLLDEINNAKVGLVGLGFQQEPCGRNIYSKKPIKNLEDVKGMKLRVTPGIVTEAMATSLGAIACPIAWGDVYSALQTGVVDGAENNIGGYYTNKHHEICPYYTYTNHEISPNQVVFSEITRKKLNEDTWKLIYECWWEADREFYRPLCIKQQDAQLKAMIAEGVTVSEISDPEKWLEAVQPLYTKHGAGYEELIRAIQDVK